MLRISTRKLPSKAFVVGIRPDKSCTTNDSAIAAMAAQIPTGTSGLTVVNNKNIMFVSLAEKMDHSKIRKAAASAVSHLPSNSKVDWDLTYSDLGNVVATAHGAKLATWKFDHYKKEKKSNVTVSFQDKSADWDAGIIEGESQLHARLLKETPANLMTPTTFCDHVAEMFKGSNVQVIVRDQEWAEKQHMGAFLSVTRGSAEPCKFLELHYKNSDQRPVALVGKGVTFDSGGISIKPSANMAMMKGYYILIQRYGRCCVSCWSYMGSIKAGSQGVSQRIYPLD